MSRRHPGRSSGRPPAADIRSVRLLAEIEIADRDLVAGDEFRWPAYDGERLTVQRWRIVEVIDPEVDEHLQRVLVEPVRAAS